MKRFLNLLFLFLSITFYGQKTLIEGQVLNQEGRGFPYANVLIKGSTIGTSADREGFFQIQTDRRPPFLLEISFMGFNTKEVLIKDSNQKISEILEPQVDLMDEVVISGTLKAMRKEDSPVPVEVYSSYFFEKNPSSNLFESLTNINGIRPQLNCQVCNTGDIHINGLEGPYTMVLIDGMPIVSSLSTVYGLFGIPNFMIDRVEVVKGPASSLYGSEAIGGLINVITKSPEDAPFISLDARTNTWQEYNLDFAIKAKINQNISFLTGVNYYDFDQVYDENQDGFTDLTLATRLSIFQKWNLSSERLSHVGFRLFQENRWGGQNSWAPEFKGSDLIYGETIDTKRWEVIGQYEISKTVPILASYSLNGHYQDSYYGETHYKADQKIAFGQVVYQPIFGEHQTLFGTALRYTYYDDNTPATSQADETYLPGLIFQDLISIDQSNELLLGYRLDYDSDHGLIHTPRVAYKHKFPNDFQIRLNAGSGYRVVNVFTEDHAALTGARDLVIEDDLDPERSVNMNLNATKKFRLRNAFLNLDFSAWYTRFSNQIIPDYDSNPNQIIYDNLDGHSVSQGLSLQLDLQSTAPFSALLGMTFQDVYNRDEGQYNRPYFNERFNATWTISYRFFGNTMRLDYTGNLYSPMLLPLLSDLDPRPEKSPWWSIQNIQLNYSYESFEIYGGIKNFLNWTPWRSSDFPLIARSFDPFDKNVEFDSDGQAISTPDNPYALTFDPTYVYASNQGLRFFLGVRYQLF